MMSEKEQTTASETTDLHIDRKMFLDRSVDSSKTKENTRKYIACLYVWAFFAVIAIVFVIGVFKSFKVDDFKDMLVTVSGVLSGPLGFIVGYYFKASSEQ